MSAPTAEGQPERSAGDVPMLVYHSVAVGGAARRFRPFVMDPGEFTAQMDYLDAEGFRPVTAAHLADSRLSGGQLPGRPVVLTFDDAYTDFYSTALPILREHNFAATLCVPTAYVGATARWMRGFGEGDRRILSWQALRDVTAEGVDVASHSHTHPQLDRVPPAVTRDEVRRSKCLLEDNLAVPVEGFAYPFGYWNRATRAAVATAGFRYGCVVADLMTVRGDDVLTLPRLTVRAGLGVTGLARLLSTRPTPGRRQAAEARRFASRTVRRGVPALGGNPREGWPE